MYEIFMQILQERGITPYKVSKETGVSQSTLSDWKKGRSTPKSDNMKKIADYLDVSVDYLMTGNEASEENQPITDYSVKFGNNEFIIEMIEKSSKLESEQDKALALAMLDTMINKNKNKK